MRQRMEGAELKPSPRLVLIDCKSSKILDLSCLPLQVFGMTKSCGMYPAGFARLTKSVLQWIAKYFAGKELDLAFNNVKPKDCYFVLY